ncbi:MAG TPA: TonB family protein, partial [Chthoniobacterales bacterium]|nr:TonB family protein [Chthoniobacterales bacterium]
SDRKFPYDREARMQRMAGTGIFRLRLDVTTGKVTEVAVMKSTGWKHLDQAAAGTLVRWRARVPASQSIVTVPVTFLNSPR